MFVCFFLSEQEAVIGGRKEGRSCTVLLTNRVKPPNESCETGGEESGNASSAVVVVGVSPMTSS